MLWRVGALIVDAPAERKGDENGCEVAIFQNGGRQSLISVLPPYLHLL